MSLNVSTTTMSFENREFLRNTAKNILTGKGASQESSERIVNSTIFDYKDLYSQAQLNAFKASVQIALNGGLKETKKYLTEHKKNEDKKKYILGELWESLEDNTKNDSELFDFNIDYSLKNIFEAA